MEYSKDPPIKTAVLVVVLLAFIFLGSLSDRGFTGSSQEETQETLPTGSAVIYRGDVNGDGSINCNDLNMITDSIIGKVQLSQSQKVRADFNIDGRVDVRDAVALGNRYNLKCVEDVHTLTYVVIVQRDDSFYELGEYFASRKGAQLLVYNVNIEEVLSNLQIIKPTYLALVLSPYKLTPDFMDTVDRLLRRVDDDIFLDVAYGYITSFDLKEGYRYVDKLLNYEIPDDISFYGVNAEPSFYSIGDYTQIRSELKCDVSLLEGIESGLTQLCPEEYALDTDEMISKIKDFDIISIGLHGTPDRMGMLNNRWIEGDREGIKINSPGYAKLRINGVNYNLNIGERYSINGENITLMALGSSGSLILRADNNIEIKEDDNIAIVDSGKSVEFKRLEIYNYPETLETLRRIELLDFDANLLTAVSCTTGRVYGSPSVLEFGDTDYPGEIDDSLALSFLKSGVLNYISPNRVAYLEVGNSLASLIASEAILQGKPIGEVLKNFKNGLIFNGYYLSSNLEGKVKSKIHGFNPLTYGLTYGAEEDDYLQEESLDYHEYNTRMWILFGDPSIKLSKLPIKPRDCIKEFREVVEREGSIITKTIDLKIVFVENGRDTDHPWLDIVYNLDEAGAPLIHQLSYCGGINIPLEGDLVNLEIENIEGIDINYRDYFRLDGIIKDLGDELLLMIPEPVIEESLIEPVKDIDLSINSVRYNNIVEGDTFNIEDREVEILRIGDAGAILIRVDDETDMVPPATTKIIGGLEIANLVAKRHPYDDKTIDLTMTLRLGESS